ncbi:MAG: CHRD domain-containing protein [Balneolaceae bacterium]
MRKIFQTILPILLCLSYMVDAQSQQTEEVILAGYEQVPRIPTPASGIVEITLDSDTLIVEGNFKDLRDTYQGAGIFYGKKGERGNRLFGLKVDLNEDRTSGSFPREDNRFTLREETLKALKAGNLYISVFSSRFQHGEIRAQIPPMR